MNEGLQGPRRQVVVMVIEAGVAFLLGLVQVLVVDARVQLPREGWSLRHVALQRRERSAQSASGEASPQTQRGAGWGVQNSPQTQTQTAKVWMQFIPPLDPCWPL